MPVYKLLEINIISAHDLPPVSKMLRTFAAVYVDPHQKLTTRVDHRGNSNPSWNYKVTFHVDDKFLKSEFSAVTVEIYNVAWLRDLPIGTAQLFINSISPSLQKNPSSRKIKLRIRGPSGHLQGILNLGVQLIDNAGNPNDDEITSICWSTKEVEEDQRQKAKDYLIEAGSKGLSQHVLKNQTTPPKTTLSWPKSEPETDNYTYNTCNNSMYSAMRPLPSEIASDMKKWVYSNDGDEFGSSIFENWTESSLGSDHRPVLKPQTPPERKTDDDIAAQSKPWKKSLSRKSSKPAGSKKRLFSFFGNAYGFEFSFICGSKKLKKIQRTKKQDNFDMIDLHDKQNFR